MVRLVRLAPGASFVGLICHSEALVASTVFCRVALFKLILLFLDCRTQNADKLLLLLPLAPPWIPRKPQGWTAGLGAQEAQASASS